MSRSLGEIGEDALIERLVSLVPTAVGSEGPGDDCSVVDEGGDFLKLLKTDALVEGVHYLKDADPEAVGWKAVARVISDFAAMGGSAERFLITLALPKSCDVSWVEGFYRGIGKCLEKYGATVAGGETCRVPEGSSAVISIAATGRVERGKEILRSGGNVGDEIWVTGRLGGSLGGKHLSFLPRVKEGAWLAESGVVTAMMDLSDGLGSDLPRLARASSCGFQVDEDMIPRTDGATVQQAVGDGEDFELLLTAQAGCGFQQRWAGAFPDLELTKIGKLVGKQDGGSLRTGWDHFQ
ncbi:thiamine-phosphate kinase [Luteolibacter sp. AS25]|uniref:thiamine-phosphate kinase n=1 Tax=Luteolibacter sp. AS25 TaxID=3135776 RepID=UPI00398AC296